MKTPPPIASLESEMAVLGCAILEPATALPACREAGLVLEDFYLERHQHVYTAIGDLFSSRGCGDLIQLTQRLRDARVLESVGGTDYLEQLADSVPTAVPAPHYAKVVAEKGRLRRLVEACEKAVWIVRNRGESLEECVAAITGTLSLSVAHLGAQETRLADAAQGVLADLDSRRCSVYPFGFEDMDEKIGGIPQTGVVVIMGVPGSGKSSLALQIALGIVRRGVGVRVFSYEMAAKAIAVNVLASMASVNVSAALRTGRGVTPFERPLLEQRVSEMAGMDIAVVDSSMSAGEIMERCRVYVTKGVRCVVIDYVQNLPDPKADSDTQRIEQACRTFQRVARDLGMLVILVSQMTGAAQREDRPPRKSDGLGSAAIDQISDMTIGVYRPCVFTPRGREETDAEWRNRKRDCYLHVLKNKQGPLGAAHVFFRDEWTRFLDLEIPVEEGSPL